MTNNFPEIDLGPIRLTAPTALAPMAALTDSVFRRMVKRQGSCGFVITEMVASEALLRNVPQATALLEYHEEERPIGAQLMGSNPDRMAAAAARVEELGFDFVDVNMGCPARKVVFGGGGAALMRDLGQAERILTAMKKAISIPLTVKIRAGWSDDCLNAPDVARTAEDCGVSLVSVHARSRAEQYRPGIRNEVLAATKLAVSIPVFANGDIRTAEGALAVMRETACDGVMAGRGAIANPWLLREIATGETPAATVDRARTWILDHFAILREELEPKPLLSKLRTFSGWYTRGLLRGSTLRDRINHLVDPDDFIDAVEEFFEELALHGGGTLSTETGASHQETRP